MKKAAKHSRVPILKYGIPLWKKDRHIVIDNDMLPKDFLDYFRDNKCSGMCDKCNYCKRVSEIVIKENEEVCEYLKFLYKEFNSKKY